MLCQAFISQTHQIFRSDIGKHNLQWLSQPSRIASSRYDAWLTAEFLQIKTMYDMRCVGFRQEEGTVLTFGTGGRPSGAAMPTDIFSAEQLRNNIIWCGGGANGAGKR